MPPRDVGVDGDFHEGWELVDGDMAQRRGEQKLVAAVVVPDFTAHDEGLDLRSLEAASEFSHQLHSGPGPNPARQPCRGLPSTLHPNVLSQVVLAGQGCRRES